MKEKYSVLLQAEPDQAHYWMSAVYEMSKLFASFASVELTLPAALRIIQSVVPFHSAVLIENRKDHCRTSVWHSSTLNDTQIQTARLRAQETFKEIANPSLFPFRKTESNVVYSKFAYGESHVDSCVNPEPIDFIFVPLRSDSRPPFGALQLGVTKLPSDLDMAFVDAFGEHLSIALERYFAWLDELRIREQVVASEKQLRQQAEHANEKLLESENRLRFALASAKMVAWDLDLSSGNAVRSGTGWELLNLEEHDVNNFYKLIHSEDLDRVTEALNEALRSDKSYDLEFRIVLTNGQTRWLCDKGQVRLVDGKPRRMAGVCVDVTARKEIEESLKESEARFRAAFDNAATGMALTGVDGNFLQANAAYCKITGYSAEELFSQSFASIIHADDLSRNFNQIQKLITHEIPAFVIDERHVRRDGSDVWVQNSVSGVWDESGNLKSFISICEDISLRKQAEDALQQKANQLCVSNSELVRFAFVASHDLKEPLRVLSSYAQLLQRQYVGKLDSDADLFVGFIVDGVKRMYELIDDLLRYSSLGHSVEELKETSSMETAKIAISNLEASISESRATVHFENMPLILADRTQFIQLFQNLIGNAIKYRGQRAPEISVGATYESGSWVFSVRDNGIGIDPMFFDRIFVLFQRLHRKNEYSGTGIGLSVCKKIVEAHGGKIWLNSKINEGSTFFFLDSR